MDINDLYHFYGRLIENGYIILGTINDFDKFDSEKIQGGSRSREGYGFYFTDTPYKCIEYGNKAKLVQKEIFNFIELKEEIIPEELYLNIDNDIFFLEQDLDNVRNERDYRRINNEIDKLKEKKDELGYKYLYQLEDYVEKYRTYKSLQNNISDPKILSKIAQALVEHGIDGFHDDNVYVIFNFEKLNQNLHDISEFTNEYIKENISRIVKSVINEHDEHYTRREDVENELNQYSEQFANKIIYCCCDSNESEIFKYLNENFDVWSLKGLIATSYNDNGDIFIGPQGGSLFIKFRYDFYEKILKNNNNFFYKYIEGKPNFNKKDKKTYSYEGSLIENGDIKGNEVKMFIKNCDIVVTNPPFSRGKFKNFYITLNRFNKQFLILGPRSSSKNDIIFNDILNNRVHKGGKSPYIFNNPNEKTSKVSNCMWYTNLKRPNPIFYKKDNTSKNLRKEIDANEKDFINYDNGLFKDTNVILDNERILKVNDSRNIPLNYKGKMLVSTASIQEMNGNDNYLYFRGENYIYFYEILGKYKDDKNSYGSFLIQQVGKQEYDNEENELLACGKSINNIRRLIQESISRRFNV